MLAPPAITAIGEQEGYPYQRGGRYPRVELPDETENRAPVFVQIIDAQTPAADPQRRAEGVIRRKGPPRHFQDAGGDAVQLA